MRPLRISIFAVFVTVALALLPGTALAVKLVPPGNSAANQYTETLPGPGGNTPSSEAKGGAPAKVLGSSNAARLEALGPEGRAAARLAAATAPHPVGKGEPGGAKAAPVPSGSSGLGQVLRQLTGTSGSGGMGLLLPLVIVLAVLAAVGFLITRRRTGKRVRRVL
jgi:hypothetical protein